MLIFSNSQSKSTGLIKMGSLKRLAMLKSESGTRLHAAEYKSQLGLFWRFVIINLRMASLDTLFLCSVGQQAWLCS